MDGLRFRREILQNKNDKTITETIKECKYSELFYIYDGNSTFKSNMLFPRICRESVSLEIQTELPYDPKCDSYTLTERNFYKEGEEGRYSIRISRRATYRADSCFYMMEVELEIDNTEEFQNFCQFLKYERSIQFLKNTYVEKFYDILLKWFNFICDASQRQEIIEFDALYCYRMPKKPFVHAEPPENYIFAKAKWDGYQLQGTYCDDGLCTSNGKIICDEKFKDVFSNDFIYQLEELSTGSLVVTEILEVRNRLAFSNPKYFGTFNIANPNQTKSLNVKIQDSALMLREINKILNTETSDFCKNLNYFSSSVYFSKVFLKKTDIEMCNHLDGVILCDGNSYYKDKKIDTLDFIIAKEGSLCVLKSLESTFPFFVFGYRYQVPQLDSNVTNVLGEFEVDRKNSTLKFLNFRKDKSIPDTNLKIKLICKVGE